MIGRSVASAMRLKCASAICGDWPSVKGAGGNTSRAEAPPSAAMRAMRAASRLPSAHTPLISGRRPPTSSWAMASTRRCSSKVQEATSVEWALMVMARDAVGGGHVAQVLAEARLVDGEVGIEGQQDGRDDAVRDVALVAGHGSHLDSGRPNHRRLRPSRASFRVASRRLHRLQPW